jgi:hypothetical protein
MDVRKTFDLGKLLDDESLDGKEIDLSVTIPIGLALKARDMFVVTTGYRANLFTTLFRFMELVRMFKRVSIKITFESQIDLH